MGQASLATFYLVFGVLTIYLNLESIGIWDANGIYRSVSSALGEYPFPVVNRTRYLDEVQDPEQVYSWMVHSFKPILFREQDNMSAWRSWNYSRTPATVASFNRVLLVRFTFKRWVAEETAGYFRKSTPYRLAGGTSSLNPFGINHVEDRATVCGANASQCFPWQTTYSFDKVGGYTEFFDPLEGPDAYDTLLSKMREAGLFDMLMATCTVDMILYNANVDMFLQYVQGFSFDFCGHMHLSNQARSFNLNVFNTSVAEYMVLYVMRVVCIVMVIIFGLIEIQRMWDLGFIVAMQQNGAVTDMISITTSFGVLLSYWIIEQMPPFKDFKFEALQNVNSRADTYVFLCDVARSLQIQGLFIALNLLVVSLRTVSLVSGLHSNLGLILKVLGVSAPNFAAFMVLFGMLQIGFVLTSFFAFGPGYSEMSDIGLCIYKSFSMLSGDMIFADISRVDNILGPIYFFSFYILFYLVLINIFVTLLMSGYDAVDYELQKKGDTDSEKNPLVLILEELKADVVGTILRYGSTAIKYARFCLDPIVVSVKATFACCRAPSFLTNPMKRLQSLRSTTIAESGMLPTADVDHVDVSKNRQNLVAFVMMLLFLAVWITLVTVQGRGLDSYLTGQATLANSALDIMFKSDDDDMKAFHQINTFTDVKSWADTAIVGLYDSPVCAESGASQWTSSAGCSSISNSQQLLNRIANWNIGFLNTTFVRLTIQPACFVATEERWASGSPTLRKTPDVDCWNSVCTKVLSSETCRTADGEILNAQSLANAINSSLLPDTVSFGYEAPGNHLGSFRMLGGLAFSLGVKKEQCQDMLALLEDNRWFTKNSASMVFDWLTYNGNMDFFTHNVVAFSLLETGILHKSSESRTFPMNVEAGGGYFSLQIVVLVLFGLYALLLLYHIIDLCWQMRCMHLKARRIHRPFKAFLSFLKDFFTEPWNLVELVSLIISLGTLVSFLVLMLNGFRSQYRFSTGNSAGYVVPNIDVRYYKMKPVVDPERYLEDDWFVFNQFEQVAVLREVFLELAALNSLWAGIKAIKTMSNFSMMSTFSNTLAHGKSRNLYFIIVINLQMLGFALAMTVIFGTMVEDFSSPLSTMGTLLYRVCGESHLGPLISVSPFFAVLFFVAFTVVFRFISTNMFLATQLNTFAALVGECDIQVAKKEAEAKMGMKQVKYRNRKELQNELELELKIDQVRVKKILRPGKTTKANVKPGDLVSRVNKEKVEWQSTLAIEEYEHVERALMPEADGSITIMFQDPPRKTMLAKMKKRIFSICNRCCGCLSKGQKVKPAQKMSEELHARPHLRPTVRNFWRFHGAIAEVEKELGDGVNWAIGSSRSIYVILYI